MKTWTRPSAGAAAMAEASGGERTRTADFYVANGPGRVAVTWCVLESPGHRGYRAAHDRPARTPIDQCLGHAWGTASRTGVRRTSPPMPLSQRPGPRIEVHPAVGVRHRLHQAL